MNNTGNSADIMSGRTYTWGLYLHYKIQTDRQMQSIPSLLYIEYLSHIFTTAVVVMVTASRLTSSYSVHLIIHKYTGGYGGSLCIFLNNIKTKRQMCNTKNTVKFAISFSQISRKWLHLWCCKMLSVDTNRYK